MAAKKFKDHSDEMEHDLHRLEDHIGDAEKQLEARRKDADSQGAEEDADRAAPGGSQDGAPAAGQERSGPA